MKPFYIYALADPHTYEVRYVGKTTQAPMDRFKAHSNGHCPTTAAWVRSLTTRPAFVLLETGEEKRVQAKTPPKNGRQPLIYASRFAETKWIKRFRRTLLNELLRDNSSSTWDWLVNPDEEKNNNAAHSQERR